MAGVNWTSKVSHSGASKQAGALFFFNTLLKMRSWGVRHTLYNGMVVASGPEKSGSSRCLALLLLWTNMPYIQSSHEIQLKVKEHTIEIKAASMTILETTILTSPRALCFHALDTSAVLLPCCPKLLHSRPTPGSNRMLCV